MRGVILDFDSLNPSELDVSALHRSPIDWQCFGYTDPNECIERIRDAEIVLVNKVVIDATVLSHATHLKYIGVLATGMNNIDLDACAARNIQVNNVAGYSTASVAQHTLLLMLMLTTRIRQYQQAVLDDKWSRSKHFCLLDYPIHTLEHKHLVIVGHGDLGQAVARLASAFNMQVSIAQRPGDTGIHSPPRQALDELLPRADVVSIHCQLSAQTYRLFDANRLSMMKPTALLINTARGPILDEAALLDCLLNQRIGGAAVDVLSEEPPSPDAILIDACKRYPDLNLIVSPHIAWASIESRQKLWDLALRQAESVV